MNFDEALKIPRDMEHREKYQLIINALGSENVKQCIPFTEEELKEAYKSDKFFNNLSLRRWHLAAGFDTGRYGEKCILIGSRLTNLYWEKCRVDAYSCSTGVSLLKECARMIVEGV
uniref:hypothetical protein n=1 Tax=Lachnoclostridium phocaeense TaxID=1871021 RepID=UPI0026DB1F7F|nr:hypothetical protein [Lachnoclostridium phocaeense]